MQSHIQNNKSTNKKLIKGSINDKELESIKKEAKTIMDKFLKALKASGIVEKDFFVERDLQTRTDYDLIPCHNDFRLLFFKNIPKSRNGFLIAEKKHW